MILCDSPSAALPGDGVLVNLPESLPNSKILLFGMDFDPEAFLAAVQRGRCGLSVKGCVVGGYRQRDSSRCAI
jgi:hypothetical protein